MLLWPWMLYLLGRSEDAAEFMRRNKVDWHNAKETVRKICERTPVLGSMVGPAPSAFMDREDMVWTLLSLWMLVGNEDGEISAECFLAELPPPDKLARLGLWRNPDGKVMFHPCHQMTLTCLVWPALALEMLGAGEAALAYARKALDVDQTNGGGSALLLRTLAHRCCGRLLAAAGKGGMDEARAAFEAAEAACNLRGYWLLAALARRDLVEHVLEPSGLLVGGGREAELAPFVARLAGPADALAALLGEGYVLA